jgi:hypothetical protein
MILRFYGAKLINGILKLLSFKYLNTGVFATNRQSIRQPQKEESRKRRFRFYFKIIAVLRHNMDSLRANLRL